MRISVQRLGIVQPHSCRRDPGPAKLLLFERFRKQAIATMRRRLIIALSWRLSRYPCCTRPITKATCFVTQ
jgi:hypothetical protein